MGQNYGLLFNEDCQVIIIGGIFDLDWGNVDMNVVFNIYGGNFDNIEILRVDMGGEFYIYVMYFIFDGDVLEILFGEIFVINGILGLEGSLMYVLIVIWIDGMMGIFNQLLFGMDGKLVFYKIDVDECQDSVKSASEWGVDCGGLCVFCEYGDLFFLLQVIIGEFGFILNGFVVIWQDGSSIIFKNLSNGMVGCIEFYFYDEFSICSDSIMLVVEWKIDCGGVCFVCDDNELMSDVIILFKLIYVGN